jgi:hypothetical protein
MREAMAKKFTLIFSTSDFGIQLWDPEVLRSTGADLPVPATRNPATPASNTPGSEN